MNMRTHTSTTANLVTYPPVALALVTAIERVSIEEDKSRRYDGYDNPIYTPREDFAQEILLTLVKGDL